MPILGEQQVKLLNSETKLWPWCESLQSWSTRCLRGQVLQRTPFSILHRSSEQEYSACPGTTEPWCNTGSMFPKTGPGTMVRAQARRTHTVCTRRSLPPPANCTEMENHREQWVKKCKACSSFESTEQLGSVTKPLWNKAKITFEACKQKQ